jgi:hypothetical protein
MIELKNITKIYQSSKEDKVVVNNDISFKNEHIFYAKVRAPKINQTETVMKFV